MKEVKGCFIIKNFVNGFVLVISDLKIWFAIDRGLILEGRIVDKSLLL